MELICQIANIALTDNDCNLMKNILQDMPMLYKAFCIVPVEEQFGLGIGVQHSAGGNQMSYPLSTALFNSKVNGLIF